MKEKITGFLSRHPFLKNIAVLISGTVLGYGIYLLCMPALSRIYSPAEMGDYDLILSSGRFVVDIISLGLIIAIMLPKEDEDAKDICQIILTLNFVFLAVLTTALLLLKNFYHLFETSVPYTESIILLAFYLFTYNIQSLFYSYTNRCKKYKVLFWNPIIQNIANAVFSVILGLLGLGTAGYLIGTVASLIICIIYMRMHISPFKKKISLKHWKMRLIEYRKIYSVQLPANIISQVGNEIPTQYLGRVFGSVLLGGYTMANRILSIPVALLATPVNRVVYQTMATKVNNHEDVGEFCFEIVEKNIKIAILPLGLLVISSKHLIPLILGNDWYVAGDYIAVLGVMFLLKFCSACISGTFVVTGKQRLSMIMSFINLAKYGICFGFSYMFQLGVFTTILISSISECLYQILNLVLCVYCTHYSMRKFTVFLIKYIVGGNALIYSLYFVSTYIIGSGL